MLINTDENHDGFDLPTGANFLESCIFKFAAIVTCLLMLVFIVLEKLKEKIVK